MHQPASTSSAQRGPGPSTTLFLAAVLDAFSRKVRARLSEALI